MDIRNKIKVRLLLKHSQSRLFHLSSGLQAVYEKVSFCRLFECYRLIDKYMPQPGLMKIRRTFRDKTCLSSDVASISFAYFLNSAHRSLKYAIQFLLIQTSQNPLQALKKLVLISQVNPFEFSLTVENKYKSLVVRLGE
jgi:hypothetical protein